MSIHLKAPFVYFGGKSTVAHVVWQRFGNVPNYCEPFFGSGAVLLSRPHTPGIETVNDKDGYIANFWRSVQHDPDAVAYHADYPAIESDLYARHAWLVGQRDSLTDKIEGDPDYYDAKIAGWWCWGMSLLIGNGFCSGNGPWIQENGRLINNQNARQGINKGLIHLWGYGKGINQLTQRDAAKDWMRELADRLKRVRVCCGDWKRITGPSVTFLKNGLTGMFLDPPYGSLANRNSSIYRMESESVAYECQQWCIENGDNKLLRIALCGYVGEHEQLQSYGWTPYFWKAGGGYANRSDKQGKENAHKEVIWFSPHCLKDNQLSMF